MIHLIVKISAPLLLASTGGLVTEIAGTLNIGLEGLILIGAFSAIVGAGITGSAAAGVVLAAISGALFALLFIAFAHKLEANLFIIGLAINLLAFGLTATLSSLFFSSQGVIRPESLGPPGDYTLPLIDSIPFIGEVFSGHTLFVPLSWVVAIAAGLVLRRTRFGLLLRATGLSPASVAVHGHDPDRFRAVAVIFSGVSCGLAGAALALDLGAFVPNLSSGRGWIALVIVFLGRRRVWGVAAASLFLAAAGYLANSIQGAVEIPRTVALAVPYLVTLASMVVFAIVERIHAKSRSR